MGDISGPLERPVGVEPSPATLLDTGPVVAAIDRSDAHHVRCAALLRALPGRRLIPSTVVVEVCWLLEERPDIEAAFLESVASGEFEHVPVSPPDLARMRPDPRDRCLASPAGTAAPR
ncbi:MAG: type II toxin-antitoxin system VapC family toxin [Actinomycetota bacterium]